MTGSGHRDRQGCFSSAPGVFFLLLLISSPAVLAQEKKEPPQRRVEVGRGADTSVAREAKLPKIDLPEFEITGREIIQLPPAGKSDQSDVGALELDPSKLATPGEKKEGVSRAKNTAAFGESLLSYDGKLNLGYGRFKSPSGELWFGKKYDEGDFGVHGRYYSHDAFVPHANASSGLLDATGGLYLPRRLRLLGGSKFYGNANYAAAKYRFYGTPTPSLERTSSSFQIGAGLKGRPDAPLVFGSSVSLRRLTLEDKDRSREDELSIAALASGELGGFQTKGDFLYAVDYLEQTVPSRDPYFLRASAGFRRLFFSKLDLSVGASVYSYRNSAGRRSSKFYPALNVQYFLKPEVTLFAQFEPVVERNSLSALLSSNPYVGNDVSIAHRDAFVNMMGGLQFELLNRGSARVYMKYQRVRDFPIYVDPSTLVYITAVPIPYRDWVVLYDGTTKFFSLSGEIQLNLTSADRLTGTVTILGSKNSATDHRVPYFAPVMISSQYSHRFPFGLATHLSGQFLSQRPIDLHDSQQLSSFFLLSARGEYQVLRNISLSLHLNNIFNEHYSTWNLYQELPFTIRGEVSVRW